MSEEKRKGRLSGQVAVVTGGSRGIGREIAQHLARAGATVVVTARDLEQLANTVALCEFEAGDCFAYEMEVTDADSVGETFAAIEAKLGPVDLLVNNAGISGPGGLLWETPIDDLWKVMDVNVRGVMLCSNAVLPGMVERKRGRIINIGSNAGLMPFPPAMAYSVSKAALVRLSENLAECTKEAGVSIFTISPGMVRTDMTNGIAALQGIPASEWTPIERSAKLCVYLASGAADVLTGRYIHTKDDDVEEMVRRADEIIKKDLHTMRLKV